VEASARTMRFVAFLMTGPTYHHTAMWQHPEAEHSYLDPTWWQSVARTLERGRFDGLFIADLLTFRDQDHVINGGQISLLDPIPIIAQMAQVTSTLGLGVTVSTTFQPPYTIARALATLDIISNGRLAWNVVTSSSDADARVMGGSSIPPREVRYQRADEVVSLCMEFWQSWNGAHLEADKGTGTFSDADRINPVDFEGQFVSAHGYFPVPPMPQGHPVLMQAGGSGPGRDFAAKWAEIIFTLQNSLEDMQHHYRDIKGRMVAHGRDPRDCAILTSVDPIVGETRSIAQEKQAYINSLITWERAVGHVKGHTGVDVRDLPLDEPINSFPADAISIGSLDVILNGAKHENLTLREATYRYAQSDLCPQIVGTPEDVADQLAEYFLGEGCDGFIISPIHMPGAFESFCRSVMPVLIRRGLIPEVRAPGSFRDQLRAGAGFQRTDVVAARSRH
jgi:FMN-dependent oxidoreductase (nitrilotriacetate monooxygenase family)